MESLKQISRKFSSYCVLRTPINLNPDVMYTLRQSVYPSASSSANSLSLAGDPKRPADYSQGIRDEVIAKWNQIPSRPQTYREWAKRLVFS